MEPPPTMDDLSECFREWFEPSSFHQAELTTTTEVTNDDLSFLDEIILQCQNTSSFHEAELAPTLEDAVDDFSILDEFASQCLDDDKLTDINQFEPSKENLLFLNLSYQHLLGQLLEKLEIIELLNKKRQKMLQDEMNLLGKKIESPKTPKKNRQNQLKKIKKIPFYFFGFPFFKDAKYNGPPLNEDTLLAENLGFRNIFMHNSFKPFTNAEIGKLRLGIRQQAISIEANRLIRQRQLLEFQSNNCLMTDEERKNLEKQENEIQRKIFDVETCPEEKLFDVPAHAFNWHTLAVDEFHRMRTEEELKNHWMHFMRPGVNCKPWTSIENRELKEYVNIYEHGVNWEEVALMLKTNRTPFECFRRYQERFNPEHRKFGWTDEDNKKLGEIIRSHYGNVSDVNWEKLRHHFPGRSKVQIYTHVRYYSQFLKTTKISASEDIFILEGINMGYDFADIALFMGKRSANILESRYKIIKNKSKGQDTPWTKEEDDMLLTLNDTSELNRLKIQKDFPCRNFAQLFCRFHYLRMKLTTPQKYVDGLKAKSLAVAKRNFPKDSVKFSRQIMGMMTVKREQQTKETPNFVQRNSNCKRSNPHNKIKELKLVVRPWIATNTSRPRKICFPGDGRDNGIILACLYRFLHCNFSLAPSEETTEKEMEKLGVPGQNYLSFINLLSLTKNDETLKVGPTLNTVICLPPTLNTLTGFRGLLLHRRYLYSSANCGYASLKNSNSSEATINEVQEETVAVGIQKLSNPEHLYTENQETEKKSKLELNLGGLTSLRSSDGEKAGNYDKFCEEMLGTSQTNEMEFENTIGNPNSDRLLLTRLLSFFFWPGVMSTVFVPADLKESIVEPEADMSLVGDCQDSLDSILSKPKKTPKSQKRLIKKRKIEHMQEVVRKRFGLVKQGTAKVAAKRNFDSDDEAFAQPTPKKPRVIREEKTEILQSDRFTRNRKDINNSEMPIKIVTQKRKREHTQTVIRKGFGLMKNETEESGRSISANTDNQTSLPPTTKKAKYFQK